MRLGWFRHHYLNVISNSKAGFPEDWQIIDNVVNGSAPEQVIKSQTAIMETTTHIEQSDDLRMFSFGVKKCFRC